MNLRRLTLFPIPLALALALAAAGPVALAQPEPNANVAQTAPPGNVPAVPQARTAAPAAEPAAEEGHAHHPEVKVFGHSLGVLGQFAVSAFNFILFAAILVALLKGALASAFQARTKELGDKLSQAERDKAEAERQVHELEARMAGLRQELEGIMAKAEADAEGEKQRILESARTEAAQIRLQTQAEIQAQQRSAENDLRALVADLVVTGAARRLEARVQGAVAARTMDRAIEQVGGAH